MLSTRAEAHSQALDSLQSPAISRCSEEGPQAQQVNLLPTSNQEKIQGNAELKYFILGVVGVGEKDR